MKVKVLLAVTGVLLLSVVLLCYWLWSWTGSLDSGSRRDGVTAQLMQRKTAATIDIRDGLAEGSFRHVERGASKLRQIGEASAWFVPDAQYGSLSDDFRDALSFLERALSRRDSTQLQKAYDHLIKSCVDCHRQASRYQIDPDTGAKASLQALRRQQADMLVIARSFSPNPGWSCTICGFMGSQPERPKTCPECDAAELQDRDVKESIVKLAERQGYAVEVVNQSEPLTRLGGVGCLLRYRLPDEYL